VKTAFAFALNNPGGPRYAEDRGGAISSRLAPSASYYIWKKKYSRLGLSELRELRQLREENAKLKRLVADLSLDRAHPAGDRAKKAVRPRHRRELGSCTQTVFAFSTRRVAGLMMLDRSTMYYKSRRDPQDALRVRLCELAASRVRFGYRRLTVMLRREGWLVNAKRIYRLYTEDGLAARTKVRRKVARRARVAALRATRPDEEWSMDLVAARLINGRWFGVLTVVDQFTRECLLLLANSSLTGRRLLRCSSRSSPCAAPRYRSR
jgi:putative transposase